MNAGRDVERLIAGWLADEAASRAPDRVLDAARVTIDRTRQRRWVAAWREPMFINPLRAAVLAGVLVIALVGGAFVGRATAPDGAGVQPTSSPAASALPGTSLEQYRTARNEICTRYASAVDPLKPQLEGLHDAATSPADRAAKAAVLLQIVTQLEAMVRELDGLEAPADLAADNRAYVTRYQDMNLLIRKLLTRVNEGDLEAAAAIDDAIDVLNGPMLAFETGNGLELCP